MNSGTIELMPEYPKDISLKWIVRARLKFEHS